MQCLTPPLSKKPAGEWLCPECKEEADLEARAAAEREAKSRKCCACGARGEEASVHALLASAWAGAVLELGPAPVGKFALCEKCAHRHAHCKARSRIESTDDRVYQGDGQRLRLRLDRLRQYQQ